MTNEFSSIDQHDDEYDSSIVVASSSSTIAQLSISAPSPLPPVISLPRDVEGDDRIILPSPIVDVTSPINVDVSPSPTSQTSMMHRATSSQMSIVVDPPQSSVAVHNNASTGTTPTTNDTYATPSIDAESCTSPSPDGASTPLPPTSRFESFISSAPFRTFVAGAGFMCDAYDLFVMNLVIVILKFQYDQTTAQSSLIATAVLAGAVVGQVIFGILCDYVGRRKGFIMTLSLLTVGATLSAASVATRDITIYTSLAIWRFILGVGIGGEYPLAATVSAESSSAILGRGRRVASVFAMLGVGGLLAPCVVLILLQAAGPGHVEFVWRAALGAGAIPGLVMLYFRISMKESEAYTIAQASTRATVKAEPIKTIPAETNDIDIEMVELEKVGRNPRLTVVSGSPASPRAASADMGDFMRSSSKKVRLFRRHARDLLATGGSWLIFDIPFYANGLFSSTVVSKWYAKPSSSDNAAVQSYLLSVSTITLILACCALPGYYVSMYTIDCLGRRRLQLIGFAGMTISYCLCGGILPLLGNALDPSSRAAFLVLYGLTFFFCNFGPCVSTFVIPTELFPAEIRSSAHGLSAALGKMGAVIGGAIMPVILDANGIAGAMYVCAGCSAAGWMWTMLLTRESRDIDADKDMREEDEAERVKMLEHSAAFATIDSDGTILKTVDV